MRRRKSLQVPPETESQGLASRFLPEITCSSPSAVVSDAPPASSTPMAMASCRKTVLLPTHLEELEAGSSGTRGGARHSKSPRGGARSYEGPSKAGA